MSKQNALIREMWLDGKCNLEIRTRLEVSKGQVSGVINRTKHNPAYAVAVAARVGASDGAYNHQVEDRRPKVQELFAKGLEDKDIGAEMSLSANAVRWYRRKLGLAHRPGGIKRALPIKRSPQQPRFVYAGDGPPVRPAPRKPIVSAGPDPNPTRTCQFPMWPDRTVLQADGTPLFCGVPSRGSWCPTHRDVVFKRCG